MEKETEANQIRERNRIKAELEDLEQLTYTRDDLPNAEVKFNPRNTMNDGKTKNVYTNNRSTRSCPDCKATPNEIKYDEADKFVVVEKAWLEMGAKSMHSGPRMMEYVINLGSSLRVEKRRQQLAEEEKKNGGRNSGPLVSLP